MERWAAFRCWVILPLMVPVSACDGVIGGDPPIVDPMEDMCEVMIEVTAPTDRLAPGDIWVWEAAGGTGEFWFSIAMNETGGIINEETGVYQAGTAPGTDRVRARDRNCRGSGSATVEVVATPRIVPERVEVTPASEILFELADAVGDASFEMVENGTGATLSPDGHYVAGAVEGRDQIRATDSELGTMSDATVIVTLDATLQPTAERVYVPQGTRLAPPITGGSGHFDATVEGDAFEYENGELEALRSGTSMVRFEDRFTGQTIDLSLHAVEPLSANNLRVGNTNSEAFVLSLGDVNGDGFPDVAVAMPAADVTRHQSGAVYIYAGSPTGFDAAPARVIAGERRSDIFGSAIASGDLDGDGHAELIVGAPGHDGTAAGVGTVYVFSGVEGGFFSDEATMERFGQRAGDAFGRAVGVCDFNGDGAPELVVGSTDAEDTNRETIFQRQGSVNIFLNNEGRFASRAEQRLFGDFPDGSGGWFGNTSARFGNALATGDFDGDGLCDLAVGARDPLPGDVGPGEEGAVLLFRGRGPDGADPGGLFQRPARVWQRVGLEASSYFGWHLDMADLNGDGKDDLAVTAQYLDNAAGVVNVGGVYVFVGSDIDSEATAFTDAAGADWLIEGVASSEYLGYHLRLADVNEDGVDDLAYSATRHTPPPPEDPEETRLVRPGALRVHYGRVGGLPASEADAEYLGTADDDLFGAAFGVVSGSEGTRFVALAGAGDDDGYNVGTPSTFTLEPDAPRAHLELPGIAAGRLFGFDVAVVGDVNGDGRADTLVGAPGYVFEDGPTNSGGAFIYFGEESPGAGREPSMDYAEVEAFGAATAGQAVVSAGDFNGDGRTDFAVVARSSYRSAYADPETVNIIGDCGAAQSGAGSVRVYLGSAAGPPSTTPSFVFFGPYGENYIGDIAGDLDVNGDGFDDLVIGYSAWQTADGSREGGAAVYFGRAAAALPTMLCAPDGQIRGAGAIRLGESMAGLGDVDGDGCDEFALGASGIERNNGGVWVVSGFGGAACPTAPARLLALHAGTWGPHAGRSMAGGGDVDGDGVLDLLVGGGRFRDGRGEVGRTYVVLGRYLSSQVGAVSAIPLVDPGDDRRLVIDGRVPGARSGTGVTFVPSLGRSGADAVAVGEPFGTSSGEENTGSVYVYSFGPAGFDVETPIAMLVGEPQRLGELGASLSARRDGERTLMAVGAPWSSNDQLEQGAAYVLELR